MRTLLPVGLLLVLARDILAAPGGDLPAVPPVPSVVEQLAVVNYGTDGPAAVTTHIENAAGDKLDFNGDHFFGRDQEKHDFNRQAHVNLERVRSQVPDLRRFLGRSIVKREGYPYPPAVVPPTHYEPPPTSPPPTTTTTTTTTTTEAPPTTTPGVPHEVYGLPPGEPEPKPCGSKTWGDSPDCVVSELLPLLPVVDLPVVPPVEQNNEDDLSGNTWQEPVKTSLYELTELVGNVFEGDVGETTDPNDDSTPSVVASGCSDCTFSQLPELPALVYPVLPANPPVTTPPTTVAPLPEPQVPDCLPLEFLKAQSKAPLQAVPPVPREDYDAPALVDLRGAQDRKETSNVLSTQSQVILVRGMEPYPVLKAKEHHHTSQGTSPYRQTKQRGSVRFVHTFKRTDNKFGKLNDDEVDGLTGGEQPVEVNQYVLCTVDCYALEEKVRAPETPAMEIPSDGRLW